MTRCPPQHYDYESLDNLLKIEILHYSFATVRNPLSRIIFDYRWALTTSTMEGESIKFGNWIDRMFQFYEKDQYTLANHTKPQHLFIGPKMKGHI